MENCIQLQMNFKHILTAGLILVVGAVLVSCCTEEDLDRCWEPMTNLPDHLTWEAIVPTLTEANMREHCRLYDQVETCLKTLSCAPLQEGLHQGLESAYHFLCDQSFDEYLKHRGCFNNSQLHAEGRHCNDTLLNRLGSLDPSTSIDYRLERICQYANDYLDCVQNAVQSFCGSEAASWQRELDYRSLTPLLSKTGCKLDGDRVYYPQPHPTENKTKTYIIVGCVVALSVIVLLILIALFIMVRNKKKAANQNSYSAGSAPNQHHMDYFAGADLPPGAAGVHAGPLPIKQPPPYEEEPPSYSPYQNSVTNSGVRASSTGVSVVGGDARSEYSSTAPSKARSVYSERSGRSSHRSDDYKARGGGGRSHSTRSNYSSSQIQDQYF